MFRPSVLFLVIAIVGHANSMPKRKDNFQTENSNDVAIPTDYPFLFFPKEKWGGQLPLEHATKQPSPVPLVLIHHTYVPGACHSKSECSQAMRSIQHTHQVTNGWMDIGYKCMYFVKSFAVGGDGAVYEGRGWGAVGAHALGFNTNSIGIVLIGDWVDNLPPQHQLQVTRDLISMGVKLGYIHPDYTLQGHRNVGATECPGQTLYEEISTWDKFQDNMSK